MFPIQPIEGTGRSSMLASHPSELAMRLKMLITKQMLQRVPVRLVQIKAGNKSVNLLNEICQIIYSLYHTTETIKKVYNNV